MIDSMINGHPFLYQDLDGTVYHVSNPTTIVNSWGSNKPIVAFIGADKNLAEPQEFLCQRWTLPYFTFVQELSIVGARPLSQQIPVEISAQVPRRDIFRI